VGARGPTGTPRMRRGRATVEGAVPIRATVTSCGRVRRRSPVIRWRWRRWRSQGTASLRELHHHAPRSVAPARAHGCAYWRRGWAHSGHGPGGDDVVPPWPRLPRRRPRRACVAWQAEAPAATLLGCGPAWAAIAAAAAPALWGKPPDRGDTTPRPEPGTGREQSRNTPLGG